MRSKDSDWVIAQALGSLYSQTFRDFELVVVDSGSTDRTLEIVRQYPCRLVQIPAADYVPGAVLNRAIAGCRGDRLVFQNSDAVPLSPHALARLLAALDDPGVDAAFGRQVPRPEARGWVRRDHAESFPAAGPAPAWMPYALPFAAMRRAAWERHAFHTEAWGSEDTEWGTWARRHGRTIRYVADAIVMHSHNYTLRELYGRRFIEGEADAFIRGDRDSIPRLARRVLGSALRDVVDHARHAGDAGRRDLAGLCAAPVRRAVSHYGYFRGHRHGEARLACGGGDAGRSQRVLSRYGGTAAREAR
jgi:rhamnosyltransferase